MGRGYSGTVFPDGWVLTGSDLERLLAYVARSGGTLFVDVVPKDVA